MNSLHGLGSWGTNLLGQAQTQLGPAAAAASGLASKSYEKGAEFLTKSTKAVRSTIKDNLATATFVGSSHTIADPREGCTRNVTEVAFIAEGAFGAVLKVTDTRTGQQYALKKIRCQEGVQVASTFEAAEREAKILTSLPAHPNIILCLGFSADQHGAGSSTVKLLLELCSNGHLLDFMDRRQGKLSAKEVLEPFIQITGAVRHLHAQKPPIQHRDLKVENVLAGRDGKWKLCDFGSCSTERVPAVELARPRLLQLQEEIDKTVTMLYRPPEMADIELNFRKGYVINEQVDLWMLGCILYTLAFYRHPFQDNATAMAITNAKYFIPSDHDLARSAKLCGLIHWLLAADPKDRPSTPQLLEILCGIGKCRYEDLLASMPEAVREKIRKLDIYAARRDTGDLPIPNGLGAATAATGGKSSPGGAAGAKGSAARPAVPPSGASPKRASQSAAPETAPAAGGWQDGFDLAFALAPSEAPQRVASPRRRIADEALSPRGGNSAPTSAQPPAVSDLLSFNTPPLAPAAPAPSLTGGLEDLLGFACTAPTPAAATSSALGASPLPVAQPGGDWSADFGSFASSTPAPGSSPQATAFSSPTLGSPAPGSSPQAFGGYPAAASPQAFLGGSGFSFEQPSPPSRAASLPSHSPPPATTPTRASSMGAAAGASPATGNGFESFGCDFADFTVAPAPQGAAAATGTQHTSRVQPASSQAMGNLLDF